jgi:putative ABC transport system permease protein
MKPLFGVALASLKSYWASALVILALGASGLATLVAIRSLASPGSSAALRLELPPIPPAGAEVPASAASVEPGLFQGRALDDLYLLLLILGWAALALAGISILTRFSAQAATRGPEIGIRRAAGASRRDLLTSLLGEGGTLLAAVLLAGLPVSALLVGSFAAAWPGTVKDGSLVPWAATAAVAVVVSLGALLPFRYAGTRYMRDPGDGQVLLGIPAFQLAMSLALLLGSMALLRKSEPGSASAGAAAVQSARMFSVTADGDAEELSRSLGRLTAMQNISIASPGTMLGLGRSDNATTDCGRCVLGLIPMRYWLVTARHHLISQNTLAVQGMRLLEGRAFTAEDDRDAPRVALVNRHLALTAFEREGAVGRDLYLANDWPRRPYRVIGIVDDVPSPALGGALQPLDTIYLSVLQHPPRAMEVSVLASDSTESLGHLGTLANARVSYLGTSREILASVGAPVGWFGRGFGLVGVVVLLAAVAGTFGTMRMWVLSMAAELGARRAVGGSRTRLVAWVLWHTAGAGVKGLIAGLVLYFAVLRVSLTNLVGHVPASEPGEMGAVAGILMVTALLGAVIPAYSLLRKPIAQLF